MNLVDLVDLILLTGAPNVSFWKIYCSGDDLRSRIFGAFAVKFVACLSRIFEHFKNGIIAHF